MAGGVDGEENTETGVGGREQPSSPAREGSGGVTNAEGEGSLTSETGGGVIRSVGPENGGRGSGCAWQTTAGTASRSQEKRKSHSELPSSETDSMRDVRDPSRGSTMRSPVRSVVLHRSWGCCSCS